MALRTLRVFISSPGDVAEERLIARRVIGRLEAQLGDLVRIEAVFWERAPLVATASFQEQLARPSETDITVLLLWSRLGTPLPSHIVRDDGSTYASGTEFEFEDAMAGFARNGTPRILAYRKTAPIVPPSDLDALEDSVRQQQAMERFVGKWFRNEADGTLKAAFHNFATPADFEDVFESHLGQLVAQLVEPFLPPGVAARGSAPTWRGSSPFRGLEVFEPQHAPVFFGRTAATASVLAKLRIQGQAGKAFVLIVSMSGGGKSSLVRAGVLPLMLQPGVIGTAAAWRHAVMRPSDGQGRLVDALERALVRATTTDADRDAPIDAGDAMRASDAIVRRVVDRLDRIGTSDATVDLVLVVDQLEEAFSDERVTPDERDAFFSAIDALARSGRVWIIATMRSDAYPLIAASPTLVALKEGDGQYDLMPPTLREIGQIIRFPASAAGLRFETRDNTAEKLDDVIRDAAASNPGALPLLQFLLEALYQRRNPEDVLTFRAYEDLGGVEGALAQRAEAVLASVSDGAQKALPAVLRELVTFGTDDDSKALRRIAPRTAFESRDANELVDALVEARLLVGTLGADGTSAISLAHEALLEFWPRLKAWRDEDREMLLIHARLAATTREWQKNARDHDLLLARGKPLAEARGLVAAGMRLSPDERALLAASETRARRFAILRNGAVASLAALAIVAGIAAWKATSESKRAQVQATTAQRTTDFMVGLFSDADPDRSQGEKITVREVLDRGVVQIDEALKDQAGVRSNLLGAMGQAYNGLGLYAPARKVLEAAMTAAFAAGDRYQSSRIRVVLADTLYQDGDYENAASLYRAVLSSIGESAGEKTLRLQSIIGLSETLADQEQFEEAKRLAAQALSLTSTTTESTTAERARALDVSGRIDVLTGRFDDGEKTYEQLLELQKARYGPQHTTIALTLNNLGLLYFQTGRYDQAVEAWQEALIIRRKALGPDHPYVAALMNNLGRVELLRNRLPIARQYFSSVLSIDRKTLPKGHDDFIPPLNSLAMIATSQGQFDEARALLDEARTIAEQRSHPLLNQVLGNLAELDIRQSRLPEAHSAMNAARNELAKQFGDRLAGAEAWRSAVLDLTDAEIARQEGRRAEAGRLLAAATPVLRNRFGSDSYYSSLAAQRTESLSSSR